MRASLMPLIRPNVVVEARVGYQRLASRITRGIASYPGTLVLALSSPLFELCQEVQDDVWRKVDDVTNVNQYWDFAFDVVGNL